MEKPAFQAFLPNLILIKERLRFVLERHIYFDKTERKTGLTIVKYTNENMQRSSGIGENRR
jgi:hypothetical protein